MPAVRSFRTLSPPGCGRGEGRECRNWARRRNRPSPGPARTREGRRGVSLGVGNILREKPMTLIRLSLTDFRNHAGVDLGAGPGLVALHGDNGAGKRSEEHTSELQSLMRISYAVFCLKKKKKKQQTMPYITNPSLKHTQ